MIDLGGKENFGGIVNASRSLIITVRDSFYLHRSEASQDELSTVRTITNRHIAWLTALRYAIRSKKSWEATYEANHKKAQFIYHISEEETPLEGGV